MSVSKTSSSGTQPTSSQLTQSKTVSTSPVRLRGNTSTPTTTKDSSTDNQNNVSEETAQEKAKALNFISAKAKFKSSEGQKKLQNFLRSQKNPPNNT